MGGGGGGEGEGEGERERERQTVHSIVKENCMGIAQ